MTLLGADETSLGLPEKKNTDSPIALQYPNGRVHEGTLESAATLTVGDRFELYGRQWQAIRLTQIPRRSMDARQRMLCVSAGANAAEPA
jgi:hypothetical protein